MTLNCINYALCVRVVACTLAQELLEDQREEEDVLDEGGEIGGCWGDKGVDGLGECVE